MRCVPKIVFFAATILSPVFAQSAASPPDLPPAMRSAIDRLLKGPSVTGPKIVLGSPSAAALFSPSEICSVPLLEMRIDHPEQFSMRTAPPHAVEDPMPRAHAPAPPCISKPD
jgi:hypothetical protein